eukprot:Opistho-2@69905
MAVRLAVTCNRLVSAPATLARIRSRYLSTQVDRVHMWDAQYPQYLELVDSLRRSSPPSVEVTVDGTHTVPATPFVTTPDDIARELAKNGSISRNVASKALVALVNGKSWDMRRPIESTSTLSFACTSASDDGKMHSTHVAEEVLCHSAAHVIGAALESHYGQELLLADGPAVPPNGLFYEARLPRSVAAMHVDDLEKLSEVAMKIAQQKHAFVRMEVPLAVAREMFADNPFKQHYLGRIEAAGCPGAMTPNHVTLYRCGSFVDLCRGPHVRNTSVIGRVHATKASGAYWLGDAKNEQLQRVYAVAFESRAEFTKWQEMMAEAAKRDHRLIGKTQSLFFMHPLSPGSAFMQPHGQRIFNALVGLIRGIYREQGYQEVSTPLMFDKRLWETSGHWQHYAEDMFYVVSGRRVDDAPASESGGHATPHPPTPNNQHGAVDSLGTVSSSDDGLIGGRVHTCADDVHANATVGLKPMNCPAHCLMFEHAPQSHRDLPLRLADFSPLHRNEIAGALSGLTRVRRFHQDDAHIFCTEDQIGDEIGKCLEFIQRVYTIFGFDYSLVLSTRPDAFVGDIAVWDAAEKRLADCLSAVGRPWAVNEKDGAFYGPKVDVIVTDAIGRKHQVGTVQLDFQLPRRFNLGYTGPDGARHTPVIIHRAVLGSVERMMAILAEHTGGKWPLWLSPRQVLVAPVAIKDGLVAAAQEFGKLLHNDGFHVDVDLGNDTFGRKVRNAQQLRYNYIVVFGEREAEGGSVSVRPRDGKPVELSQEAFLGALRAERSSFGNSALSAPASEGAEK